MHPHEKPSHVLMYIPNREKVVEGTAGIAVPMPGEVWMFQPKEHSAADFMFGGTTSYHAIVKVEFNAHGTGDWVHMNQLGTLPSDATVGRTVLLPYFIENYTLISGRFA